MSRLQFGFPSRSGTSTCGVFFSAWTGHKGVFCGSPQTTQFFQDGMGETTNCSCNDFWNHPIPNKRYIKKRMFRGSRYYSMGPPTVVSRFILYICIYIYIIYSYTQIRGEIHPSNFTMVFSCFFWTKSCILRTLQKALWSCVRQHGNIMTYFITSLFSKSPWILLRFFGVLMVGPWG